MSFPNFPVYRYGTGTFWASRRFAAGFAPEHRDFRMFVEGTCMSGEPVGFPFPLSRVETNLTIPNQLPQSQAVDINGVVWEVRGSAKDRAIFAEHASWRWVFVQTFVDGAPLGVGRTNPHTISVPENAADENNVYFRKVVEAGWHDDSVSLFAFTCNPPTCLPALAPFDVSLLFGHAPSFENDVTARITLFGTWKSTIMVA